MWEVLPDNRDRKVSTHTALCNLDVYIAIKCRSRLKKFVGCMRLLLLRELGTKNMDAIGNIRIIFRMTQMSILWLGSKHECKLLSFGKARFWVARYYEICVGKLGNHVIIAIFGPVTNICFWSSVVNGRGNTNRWPGDVFRRKHGNMYGRFHHVYLGVR